MVAKARKRWRALVVGALPSGSVAMLHALLPKLHAGLASRAFLTEAHAKAII